MMDVIDEKLTAGGYVRVGFESYALPDDPMNKAFNDRTAWYAATGHQPGGRVNYIAVGSSSKVNLGDDYYAQNFYDITSYKKCLDKGKFPIFRGMKLSKDDAIRQHATQHIKSFLGIDFKYFKESINIYCCLICYWICTISCSVISFNKIINANNVANFYICNRSINCNFKLIFI